MYKVLIAEDHALLRFGLKTAFEAKSSISKIYEAYTGEEAIELIKNNSVDAVIMDLGLPNMNGIEAAKEIQKIDKNIKIIILTSHSSEEEVIESIKAGARAYCSKEVNPDKIADIVSSVIEGALWFDSKIANIILNEICKNSKRCRLNISNNFNLTDREKEILNYICEGLNNSDISKILDVSINTVKTHVSSIIQKLGVEDRTQAVVKAYKNLS